MTDRITANLPAKSFDETEAFYKSLGFTVDFRDGGWMIMSRGPLELEFFPYHRLKPRKSSFSACVRVSDVDTLYEAWAKCDLPTTGIPRLTVPKDEGWGFRMFALIDPNGSLLRCITPLQGAS